MKEDLECWEFFLELPQAFSRPFFEFDSNLRSEQVDFATDASRNPELGAGGNCGDEWFILQWNSKFITKYEPSIAYLELYALTIGIISWLKNFKNKRITVACDNMSVVWMINSTTSGCKNCMILIRLIVLQCLIDNVKLTARYVKSKDNLFPDLLSRLKYDEFRRKSRALGESLLIRIHPYLLNYGPWRKYG